MEMKNEMQMSYVQSGYGLLVTPLKGWATW